MARLAYDVTAASEGRRADALVRALLPELAPQEIRGVFARRDVKLDGVRIKPDVRVRAGQCLEVFYMPPETVPLDIVYRDRDVLVVNKPAGMPVHQSVRHRDDTLANYFAYLFPELTFRAVNRLDKDTSGLCIIAKNPHAANIMQNCAEKTYYAAVHGVTDESGVIDAPIAREGESIIRRCVRSDGRRAVTLYRRIACNGRYSLLEIKLETGRTHQIRVHFSHIGHPLAGDDMYGGGLDDIGRQALHCGKMSFNDPLTGEPVTVSSEIPEDIKALF